ncbi:MAG: hypothetical protein ABFR95_04595 [Actinomycetota bacterium]
MFEFKGSPVEVRDDLRNTYVEIWRHLAEPGPTLTGSQRVGLAEHVRAARSGDSSIRHDMPDALLHLASTLFRNPADVDGFMVRHAAEDAGNPMVVEIIGLVSMLAAVDGAHRGLTAELEPLPDPMDGEPTGVIAEGLKQRRTHVPMPAGPIPVALDLVPEVGQAYRDSFGPQYMTEAEMAFDDFNRIPGLNRAQIEIISSRISIHNECFY